MNKAFFTLEPNEDIELTELEKESLEKISKKMSAEFLEFLSEKYHFDLNKDD